MYGFDKAQAEKTQKVVFTLVLLFSTVIHLAVIYRLFLA